MKANQVLNVENKPDLLANFEIVQMRKPKYQLNNF